MINTLVSTGRCNIIWNRSASSCLWVAPSSLCSHGPGPLDENSPATVDGSHGSDRLHGLDLRLSAPARRLVEGGTSTNAARHCRGEKEGPYRLVQDAACWIEHTAAKAIRDVIRPRLENIFPKRFAVRVSLQVPRNSLHIEGNCDTTVCRDNARNELYEVGQFECNLDLLQLATLHAESHDSFAILSRYDDPS